MRRILGLDLGVASIGWALVDEAESDNEQSHIVDEGTGARVFQTNQERAAAGSSKSKNANRREHRSARRMRDRTRRRKRKLKHILKRVDMCPANGKLDDWFQINPYKVRTNGLDKELTKVEFGRALYHMCQRRGFKSNRKGGDQNEGVVKEAIEQLNKSMEEEDARTLGEFLYKEKEPPAKKRDRYTHREQYLDEFEKLWSKQKSFNPDFYSKKLKNEIHDAIYYQRPVGSQSHLIGKCSLEPDKKRVPKGHLLFQKFRILKNVNNLQAFDENLHPVEITEDQRELIKEKLFAKKSLTFNKIRKLFGWNGNASFNLEEGSSNKLLGHTTNARLSYNKAFGKRWQQFDQEMQDHIVDVLLHVEKPAVVKELAINRWDCTKEEAEYLSNLELETGYGNYSSKALKKLLPHLEKGLEESTAIKKAGYDIFTKKEGKYQELPMPDDIRNPVVYHALIELRKVVNAIIREYGIPDVIRVELARDLKAGTREREEIQDRQKKNKRINDKANEALKKAPFNVQNPTYEDRLWYKLWEECDGICPYTGNPIAKADFNTGKYQIEHIIPYSRSVDDSYMNKTLCHADENRKKGNRTPYEMYSHDEELWDKKLQYIRNLPYPKRRKFTKQEVDLEDFVERQLVDTRYISKQARTFLQHLPAGVEVVKGQTTSTLRYCWSLNRILHPEGRNEKNRSDHRHHAIDAVVVALTSPGTLQELSKSHVQSAAKHNKLSMDDPWDGFFDEVEKNINNIIVSHRVHRKISGALHEETFYGPTEREAKKDGNQWLVLRKPVHQLTKKDLGWNNKTKIFEKKEKVFIRDSKIRKIVQNKVMQKMKEGLSFNKAVASLEEDYPLIISPKATVPIKKVRILYKKKKRNFFEFEDNGDGEVTRLAVYGKIHHIAIYNSKDDSNRKDREGVAVPMMEAARRDRNGEQIVLRDDPDMGDFIMSFSQDEMIRNKEDDQIYRLKKKSSSKKMTFQRHNSALKESDDPNILRRMPNTLKAQKITVSPIGKIKPAND